ncbi:helix-turn-helix domain-containing protein [Streptomyces sp. NPDC048434]|uniref:helix-turn-helix domain-containing protein n=1 Tax=Streptomyces sp. NPDC048434 TaxID=3365549 RepID=UPI0037238451
MATPPKDRDLDRLASYVTARRHDLGMGREAIARTVGLAKGTWTRLEQGAAIRDVNYAKIDKALSWAAGSCMSVAAGRDPVVLHPKELAPGVVAATVPVEDMGDAVRQSVESASIAVTNNLTAQEIRELGAKVVDILKARGLI